MELSTPAVDKPEVAPYTIECEKAVTETSTPVEPSSESERPALGGRGGSGHGGTGRKSLLSRRPNGEPLEQQNN